MKIRYHAMGWITSNQIFGLSENEDIIQNVLGKSVRNHWFISPHHFETNSSVGEMLKEVEPGDFSHVFFLG